MTHCLCLLKLATGPSGDDDPPELTHNAASEEEASASRDGELKDTRRSLVMAWSKPFSAAPAALVANRRKVHRSCGMVAISAGQSSLPLLIRLEAPHMRHLRRPGKRELIEFTVLLPQYNLHRRCFNGSKGYPLICGDFNSFFSEMLRSKDKG